MCLRSIRRGYPGLYLHLLCIRIWWWQFDIDHVLCGADNRLAADRYPPLSVYLKRTLSNSSSSSTHISVLYSVHFLKKISAPICKLDTKGHSFEYPHDFPGLLFILHLLQSLFLRGQHHIAFVLLALTPILILAAHLSRILHSSGRTS